VTTHQLRTFRQGGNYTQPWPEGHGCVVYVAFVAYREVGRYDSEQEAAARIREPFEGLPMKEIRAA
jgi:hypothetical protein